MLTLYRFIQITKPIAIYGQDTLGRKFLQSPLPVGFKKGFGKSAAVAAIGAERAQSRM